MGININKMGNNLMQTEIKPSFNPLSMIVTWDNGQSMFAVSEALLEDYKTLTHFIPEAIVKELNLYEIDTWPLVKRMLSE